MTALGNNSQNTDAMRRELCIGFQYLLSYRFFIGFSKAPNACSHALGIQYNL